MVSLLQPLWSVSHRASPVRGAAWGTKSGRCGLLEEGDSSVQTKKDSGFFKAVLRI